MRSLSRPQGRTEGEIEEILGQLRRQVAQLRGLERASHHEGDLHTNKKAIAELHWRLARLVAIHSHDGRSVAA